MSVANEDIEEHIATTINAEVVLAWNTEAVETAAQCQRLESLSVDRSVVDALGKVEDTLVGAVLLALVDDRLCHIVTHSLDGCQSKTNLSFLVNTELQVRFVDIGP